MAFTAKKSSFGFSIEGDKTLMRRFERTQKEVPTVLQEVLVAAAKQVLRGALSRVPVRDGHLKRSGRLDVLSSPVSPDQIIHVSFGVNPFVPYALVVHERVIDSRSGKIIRHKGNTQAKYLIEPFEREVAKLEKYAYQRIHKMTIFSQSP